MHSREPCTHTFTGRFAHTDVHGKALPHVFICIHMQGYHYMPIHSAGHTDATNPHMCIWVPHMYTYVEGHAHKLIDTVVQALSCSQKVQVHARSQSSHTQLHLGKCTHRCTSIRTYRGLILRAGLEAASVHGR